MLLMMFHVISITIRNYLLEVFINAHVCQLILTHTMTIYKY